MVEGLKNAKWISYQPFEQPGPDVMCKIFM